MPTTKKRKLRAILFADIVGYTSLMQKDEAHASVLLQKFRNTLNEKVTQHSGEVINNYGDGCLCTFESAVDAMTCAKTLQLQFQKEPIVPVRIGLHSGDVFFEDDNVFGDSVNIASRIESLGVAGGVLFSEPIKRHISNQLEFEFQSLGEFDFKNVEKTMEVFALANKGLAIPKREEIKGKLKVKTQSSFAKWLLPSTALLLVAIGIFFWQNTKSKDMLSQEILDSRIAVLPYENLTNDTTLNVLGNMAADWITRNLLNLDDVKIVQFDNVKDNLKILKASTNQFANQTGAEKIIKGKFYQEGEELIFESQIIDPKVEEVEIIFALPIVRGDKSKPSELISQLSQRIAGYFALQESDFSNQSAPKYEAFVALEEGMKFFGRDYDKARVHLNHAIQLDSSFFMPYNMLAFSYANQGRFHEMDSIFQFMKQLKVKSKLEKHLLALLETMLSGNLNQQFHLARNSFNDDPKHLSKNFMFGLASLYANKPSMTIATYEQFDRSSFDFSLRTHFWWFGNYAKALMRLERYAEALEILREVPADLELFDDLRAQIYVLQNQTDSLHLLLQKMENNGVPENQILARLYKIAFDFGANGDKANQMEWGNRILNRIKNGPESIELPLTHLANAYFITEDYENMLSTYEQVKQKNGETWEYLVHVGYAYAKLGNMEMVEAYLKKYKTLETPYSFGSYKYAQAMVYAGLGNKEEAMRYLNLAFKEGYRFGLWDYNYSYELSSLRGYAPFEEFVKPKKDRFNL